MPEEWHRLISLAALEEPVVDISPSHELVDQVAKPVQDESIQLTAPVLSQVFAAGLKVAVGLLTDLSRTVR